MFEKRGFFVRHGVMITNRASAVNTACFFLTPNRFVSTLLSLNLPLPPSLLNPPPPPPLHLNSICLFEALKKEQNAIIKCFHNGRIEVDVTF